MSCDPLKNYEKRKETKLHTLAPYAMKYAITEHHTTMKLSFVKNFIHEKCDTYQFDSKLPELMFSV